MHLLVVTTTQHLFIEASKFAGNSQRKSQNPATFCKLRRTSTLEEDLRIELAEHVSHLYGIKGQNVNRARHAIFNAKHYICIPCVQTLLHINGDHLWSLKVSLVRFLIMDGLKN